MWNKYVKNRQRQPTQDQRPPVSLQKISTPLEAFHSSLSPSTPTSPASQLSSSHYHRDGYPSPPSEQTDYNSPPTTPSQSARARARGFSWGSSIRSSVSATSPKPRPVSVMATPSSSAAAAESDYMSGQTPAAWRHPPGVAFGNTTEVESPGRYYVFESPTTERRRHQFVSDSAVVQKEGENWSIYGIPYEKTSANTPAVRTKLSQRAAREEDAKNSRLLEPLGIPYVTASPGAPPFMRAQSATEFQRELEEQRVRKAGGHGHKTSHSLPHVVAVVAHNRTGSGGSISRLRKRRAFTGELQMPPTLASMWESSSTPSSAPPAAFVPSNSGSGGGGGDAVESPSSQKQRFLRMLYSRGGARAGNSGIGNNNGGTDSTGSTTPQLERARTAVPVQVKRSASGPLPVKTSQRPSVSPVAVSEASSVASGEAGTSPLRRATTVSSEAVSSGSEKVHHRQRNRYDFTESSADEDEDESTGPASTPHSLNEYLGLKIDTTISAPQSQQQSQFQSPEKKPSQKSPFSGLASQAAAFQRPPRDRDHEQDPELDLDPRESLECGSSVYSAVRPPMDYSPMNPYVEWTKAAEAPMPDLRTHESDTDEDKSGNLRERIPGQKRSSRQRNELRQSRQDDKRGAQIDAQQQSDPSTARGTRPGITLPRIPALSSTTGGFGRQPPSSIDTEKNNSANTYRVRDTGRSTKKEKPAKNAGEGQIDKPTVQPSIPKSSTEKPRSKQQEQRVKMPARMATPPMDEDDILELYWDRYADDQRLQDLAARQRTTRHQSDVREPSSWDVACREYFVAKYRERLRAENWRNEPYRSSMGLSTSPRDSKCHLPAQVCDSSQYDQDEDILPYLLGDRLFYLALTLSASLTTPYSQQLWELFGTHPGHLLSLYASLSSSAHASGSASADLSRCLAAALGSRQRTSSPSSPSSSSGDADEADVSPSLDALMSIITRKLDGSGVSPHEMLLRQIKAQMRRVQQDLKSRPELAKCWTTRGSSQGESSTTSPLFHGLQQYLVSRSDVLPRVLEHANDMLPNLTALLDASDRPFPSSAEGPAPTTDVTLVFDAAGSGKTRFLRDKVLETGGFYFVAPNVPCMRPPVPPKDQLNDDRSSSGSDGSVTLSTRGNSRRQADPLNQLLLGETRGHASRDTYTLYQDLSFLEDVGITGGRRAAAGRQQDSLVDMKLCVEPLLRARRYMLDNMPSYQKSPIRWLQLQIVTSPPGGEDDSSALDVSDIALRFFRLSPRWGGSQSVHSLDDGELSNISASVPICFDEVQALKDNSLAERMFQSMIECHTGHAYVATTSLDVPLAKTRGRSSKSSSSTKSSTTKYMSSSRTNVSNPDTFWSVLSHHAWSIASEMFELQSQQPSVPDITRSSRQYCSPDQQRVDHYPLLTRDGQPLGFLVDMMAAVFPLDSSRPLSTGDTWAAVERELLTNWTIFSADIRDETITRECTRYFGRVRWAATFTEELLRASASSVTQSSRTGSGMIGKLSPADVLAASTRTSDRIKAAIKRQIHAIRDTGCLHEFLTTAVEADTLGVPREFVGEIAAKLVAAGLALVYEGEAGSARSSLVSERGDGTVDSASVRQVRARLSEPIVLEAAIEYIRDCAVSYSAQRGSLDAMSRRLIAGPLSVGGVSGLTGKNVSENAIAAALKRLLHFPSDEIAMHRRAAFVSIAQSATLMSSNTRSNLAQLLKGSLDRYHLYDSGLDIDRGEGGGRRWTADEWLLAHHRAAFAGDSPLSQSLPNFFFLPDLAAGHEGSGRGRSAGLGNCMFFLSDYEDMRKRVLCVVQFPPTTPSESSPASLSPLSARGPDSSMWSHSPRPLPSPPISTHRPMSRTAQLVDQIQNVLPRVQSTWPVVYMSVGGDRAAVTSEYPAGIAGVQAEPDSQASATSWSRGMDRSRHLDGIAHSSHTRNNSQPAYGHGPMLSRPGLSHRRAATEGRHVYGETAQQQQQSQRMDYLVHVDEKSFAQVCGQTLVGVVTRS